MLAYMDDILDPEDAHAIGKKIEESEFATNLLHRIRDVMRRLRLGAPNVSDRSAGLDPNTVAEYLDNTLADDRVPDFEKVCLESDVHLAEVAACHQILTLVLGEPAEVDPVSRQRMYHLPEVLASRAKTPPAIPPKLPQPAAGDGDHREEEAAHAHRARPEVPDYLRGMPGRRRLWAAVAGVAAVGLVVLIVLTLTGQLEPGTPLGKLLGLGGGGSVAQGPEASQPESAAGVGEAKGREGPEKPAPGEAVPEAGKPQSSAAKQPVDQPSTLPAGEPGAEKKVPSLPLEKPGAQAPPASNVPGVEPVIPPGKGGTPATAKPETPNPLRPPGGESPPSRLPVEPQPKAATPAAQPGGAAKESQAPSGVEPRGPVAARGGPEPGAKPAPPRPPEVAPVPPEQVGRFLSSTGILLKWDPDSVTWQRVPPQGAIMSQDKILSLPAFRAAVLLIGEIRLEMIDGTRIDVQPVDAQGIPGVAVDFGRLIIKAEGKEKSRLRLQIGDRMGVIAFGDPDAAVAVQVSRARSPGVDPETQPPPRTADLYVATGRILWQEGAGREPVAVNAPVRLTLNDKPLEAVAVQQFPHWVNPDPEINPLDQRAANTLERELQERPIALGLRELADHRQREVRWLAMRCLGYLGDFGLTVKALNDLEQRQVWPECVEQLREAVVRSPETAAAIRTAMEKLYGAEGASLYEMLWKYPDHRLSSEDADRLIGYLDHETLAFRVVAFLGNLKRITGWGFYYQPEHTAAKRQAAIAKWKERLKNGYGAAGAALREKPGAAVPKGKPGAAAPSEEEKPDAPEFPPSPQPSRDAEAE